MTNDELRERFEAEFLRMLEVHINLSASEKAALFFVGEDARYSNLTVQAGYTMYIAAHEEMQGEIDALRKDGERWRAFTALWNLCTEMSVTQNEEGGYSVIFIEFVENTLMDDLHGNTPDDVLDIVVNMINKYQKP